MISLVVLPSAVRRAMWAWVRGSVAIRVKTIRQRAELACPVAAAVEAVAGLLAGGGVDGAGAAQRGEARLGAQPGGVVADGDQQRGGDLGSYAGFGQEPGWGAC
jgi:hypothetical protein